ncbi:P-II family nitrogen regulator [Rhabdobacter roseus]|uniref:Nitrogen regulatory protein P-II 1 n=1 Tax=Rhabdobacter roseus TaxID=1655419 RepID=A0A840TPU8_9BACT|nr:P-II family nitrogen regulator [Rhabdobacter roseus]MBB5286356.1 nitrogen regulatory protein P-II 1 [Rhabdobacter roseus]
MKRVEAIIRKTKFTEMQAALHDAGIDFLSYWEVRGVGKAVEERSYRGIVYDTSVIERIMVVFYCQDQFVEPAIKAIMASAKTGEIGDGKIFISDIEKAIKIRTSEEGSAALN